MFFSLVAQYRFGTDHRALVIVPVSHAAGMSSVSDRRKRASIEPGLVGIAWTLQLEPVIDSRLRLRVGSSL